jgi:hypothetical protein
MNPLNHIDERWFWGAFIALMLVWVVYLYATRPPMRPTDPVPADVVERNPVLAR